MSQKEKDIAYILEGIRIGLEELGEYDHVLILGHVKNKRFEKLQVIPQSQKAYKITVPHKEVEKVIEG
jgi:septum formation inhibitor-activating ATPase MinD